MRQRVRTTCLLALCVLLSACSESGFSPAAVAVERDPIFIRVRSGDLTISVRRTAYRLEISSGGALRTMESTGGGPFYERDGSVYTLSSVMDDRDVADGVELSVETTEGLPATVTLRF